MKNSLPKILITGGFGQLATALRNHPLANGFTVINCARAELDITNTLSIENAFTTYLPDIVVNTAAYTAVDKAEAERELAQTINHLGAKNIARLCQQHKIPLIHLSTDYVFDGLQQNPYTENDETNPLSVYGRSKLDSEYAVRTHCEQYVILRVSGIFSEYGNNFLKTIIRLAGDKKSLSVVSDQSTCPTYAHDIAKAIYIIANDIHSYGTYHFCSAEPVSWHNFAVAIIAEAENHKKIVTERIHAISSTEYNAAAKRPAYSVLNCGKIKNDYGIEQPSWLLAFKQIMENYK